MHLVGQVGDNQRDVEQWSARMAHNHEVVGSSPTVATMTEPIEEGDVLSPMIAMHAVMQPDGDLGIAWEIEPGVPTYQVIGALRVVLLRLERQAVGLD